MNRDNLVQEKKALKEFMTTFLATDREKSMNSLAEMLWYHEQNGIAIKVEIPVKENDGQNAVTLSSC